VSRCDDGPDVKDVRGGSIHNFSDEERERILDMRRSSGKTEHPSSLINNAAISARWCSTPAQVFSATRMLSAR